MAIDRGEESAKNTFDLGYPSELAARVPGEVLAVIAAGRAVRNHTPFTGAAGEDAGLEYIFSPVFDGQGSVEEVTCTARDITDRERMEQAITASEEQLQQVFAQAPVAIIVFRGQDFVVELANPFYRSLLQGKQLIGRRFAEKSPRHRRLRMLHTLRTEWRRRD